MRTRNIFDREILSLVIGSFIILSALVLTSSRSYAASSPISCETNFSEKEFVIQNETIAFKSEDKQGRSISSLIESSTRKTHKGVKKILYVGGNKHVINIKNLNDMNSNDDFLAITSPKGHKMTYPLNCNVI